MKHLNEFEEFDPSDFEDFEQDQKDLRTLGFKDRLVPGVDFGWVDMTTGKYLVEPTDNTSKVLRISLDGIDLLKKGGAILKSFSDSQNAFDDIYWSCGWNPYGKGGPKYQYDMSMFVMKRKGYRVGENYEDYSIYGRWGDSGFGISGAKSVPKKSIEDINRQMFDKLKEFRIKIG